MHNFLHEEGEDHGLRDYMLYIPRLSVQTAALHQRDKLRAAIGTTNNAVLPTRSEAIRPSLVCFRPIASYNQYWQPFKSQLNQHIQIVNLYTKTPLKKCPYLKNKSTTPHPASRLATKEAPIPALALALALAQLSQNQSQSQRKSNHHDHLEVKELELMVTISLISCRSGGSILGRLGNTSSV